MAPRSSGGHAPSATNGRCAARGCGCPRPLSGAAGPAAATGEADEDCADPRAGLEPPRHGIERGQAQLLLDQLLAHGRPLAHALILAAALPCRYPRERRVSMCWSKHEREQWEREQREAELEAERIRVVSATPAREREVEADEEREEELVRA